MTSVLIPKSTKEVVKELGVVGELLTATEWRRAALIASVVRPQPGGGGPREPARNSRFYSASEFAELGIKGLRSKNTVALYVQRWLEATGSYPELGRKVTLPTDDWPPTRTGTDGYDSDDGAERTIERLIERHGPEVIAKAVSRPDVAAAVVDHGPAHEAVIRDSNQRDRRGTHTPSGGGGGTFGGIVDVIQKALMQIGAVTYADSGQELVKNVQVRVADELPWRPGERERLERLIESGIENGQLAKTLLAGVTDEGLAEFLGQSNK